MNPIPRRILVVDDEPLVRDSIRKVLRLDGHTAEVATHGDEALALFQKFRFDLAITDHEMPGLKGDQLAAAIKAMMPAQSILMISAYGDQIPSLKGPLVAVDAVLTKPFRFRIEELRQAVASLLLKFGNFASVPVTPGSVSTGSHPK